MSQTQVITDELFSEKVYTYDNDWKEFIERAMRSGAVVRIDAEIFDYFLEVLPPIYMNRKGATGRHVSFGFAEGAEHIVDFWKIDEQRVCQCSNMINPYA